MKTFTSAISAWKYLFKCVSATGPIFVVSEPVLAVRDVVVNSIANGTSVDLCHTIFGLDDVFYSIDWSAGASKKVTDETLSLDCLFFLAKLQRTVDRSGGMLEISPLRAMFLLSQCLSNETNFARIKDTRTGKTRIKSSRFCRSEYRCRFDFIADAQEPDDLFAI